MQQMQFDLIWLVHSQQLKTAAPQSNFYMADNSTLNRHVHRLLSCVLCWRTKWELKPAGEAWKAVWQWASRGRVAAGEMSRKEVQILVASLFIQFVGNSHFTLMSSSCSWIRSHILVLPKSLLWFLSKIQNQSTCVADISGCGLAQSQSFTGRNQ